MVEVLFVLEESCTNLRSLCGIFTIKRAFFAGSTGECGAADYGRSGMLEALVSRIRPPKDPPKYPTSPQNKVDHSTSFQSLSDFHEAWMASYRFLPYLAMNSFLVNVAMSHSISVKFPGPAGAENLGSWN